MCTVFRYFKELELSEAAVSIVISLCVHFQAISHDRIFFPGSKIRLCPIGPELYPSPLCLERQTFFSVVYIHIHTLARHISFESPCTDINSFVGRCVMSRATLINVHINQVEPPHTVSDVCVEETLGLNHNILGRMTRMKCYELIFVYKLW